MEKGVSVIFFDLFFTLVTPHYLSSKNENDVLNLSINDWEAYAEDDELYFQRATGEVKNPRSMIRNIVDKMNIDADDHLIDELLQRRKKRMEHALIHVDVKILDVLSQLKKSGKGLCLISNSDSIDSMYWSQSPLSKLFDQAIFSWNVGYLKPQNEIYNIALRAMNADTSHCLFVGDGGSDELKGARNAGMKTVFTSYLLKRNEEQHKKIMEFADYYIEDFSKLKSIVSI